MTTINFIEDMILNIQDVRNKEFTKYNFVYEDKVIDKKELNENSMEYKNFKSVIIKKSQMEKMKPGNMAKKVYETDHNEVDILEDDIFVSDSKGDDVKLDIDTLSVEEKLNIIHEFLSRKNIYLDEASLKKIEDMVNDTSFPLKKYINISKIYQQVIKIGFIKKRENGTYEIDLSEKKLKKPKKFFIK